MAAPYYLVAVLLQLIIYGSLIFAAAVQGKFIQCACTTEHCKAQGTTRCNTTSMCYTQYLLKKDGSDPVTRGCINSKTPLLCENRRPAVPTVNWPILICCKENLCNVDTVPTPPAWVSTEKIIKPAGNVTTSTETIPFDPEIVKQVQATSNATVVPSNTSNSRTMSPIYIVVLVAGICSLMVIAVVAVTVIRRQARLFDARYIQRNTYLKGHRQGTRDDPDLALPLPNGGIYDNKIAVNT